MARRKIHTDTHFNGYRVNVTDRSGVYEIPMTRIIGLVESCFDEGYWSVVHIRYVLDDGASNAVVIQAYKNRLRENFKYAWVLEKSTQDAGDQHYHMAVFVNRTSRRIEVVKQIMAELKSKNAIKSYRVIPPEGVHPSLQEDMDFAEIEDAMRKNELLLKNRSAVKFAIFWFSYLAKEKTKILSQRIFGSSRV